MDNPFLYPEFNYQNKNSFVEIINEVVFYYIYMSKLLDENLI